MLAAQPENLTPEVQPAPVVVDGATGVVVEGAAGVTADAAAGVTTAAAPGVQGMPGAEQAVVQQAVPVPVNDAVPAVKPGAQAGGGNRRRAARKLA